jgi:dTDP-4-amino-4,6-dideoxygalactose transaminase
MAEIEKLKEQLKNAEKLILSVAIKGHDLQVAKGTMLAKKHNIKISESNLN